LTDGLVKFGPKYRRQAKAVVGLSRCHRFATKSAMGAFDPLVRYSGGGLGWGFL
jgi:hypothetical protein